MQRILVAVDGSSGANRAARFAAKLVSPGGVLELVHVYDATTAAQLGMRALSKEELAEHGELLARGSFDGAARAIEGACEIVHHVAYGHPADEIVARARETNADVVVVGSRGLAPLERVLLGSVSRKVIALAERPTLVVP
jgi:nucleotide-binding universal stress UspA family protein